MEKKINVAKEMRRQMLMILGAMLFILTTMIVLFAFFPPEGHIVGETITDLTAPDSEKKNQQTMSDSE